MKVTTLQENVNNRFFQQRNALTGRVGEITALVEDYADTYLWATILHAARPDRSFRLTPYQEGGNLTQGKKLIVEKISNKGGEAYIGCIDSDQSYLLRNYGDEVGEQLVNCPYLFHTYAYSIENLQCTPPLLDEVVLACTSLHSQLPLEAFFRAVSNTIYEVFVLDLFLRSKGSKTVLGNEKWKYVYPGGSSIRKNVKAGALDLLRDEMEKKVKPFVKQLKGASEYDASEVAAFERQLLADNAYLNKDNCCLFVYGHEQMKFVACLLEEICNKVCDDEKLRINSVATMTKEVKEEKIRHLEKVQQQPARLLSTFTGFVTMRTELYRCIAADLGRLV